MSTPTFEGILTDLEEAADDGSDFELSADEARILVEGIRNLQRNYDRASRYQYPDTTGS